MNVEMESRRQQFLSLTPRPPSPEALMQSQRACANALDSAQGPNAFSSLARFDFSARLGALSRIKQRRTASREPSASRCKKSATPRFNTSVWSTRSSALQSVFYPYCRDSSISNTILSQFIDRSIYRHSICMLRWGHLVGSLPGFHCCNANI
jgi:hypothetical protein